MSLFPSLLLGAASLYSSVPVPQPPIVVTASRTAQSVNETLAGVSLITRADIETSGSSSLLELLRLEAGVEFSRTGGAGQQTSLFLRGTDSNHVLVLIDGVRVNSVQTGAFAWEHILLSQIQRVEILRGPAAAFYGSDAIGGVIQIFTRRPRGPTAHVETGSYDTYGVSAGLGGGTDWHYHITASRRQTDGFSAQNSEGFAFNPDDDGYENTSLTAGLSAPVGEGRLSLDAWHADGEVEFDQGVTDTRNQSANAQFSLGLHQVRLGVANSELETPAFDTGFDSERVSLDYQYQRPYLEALWTVGLNYTIEDGESYSLATGAANFRGERNNLGVFGGVSYPIGDFEAELALRLDENSEFDTHATGKAALGWQLNEATRVWASYGTAFRAPNFSELFSPGFGGLFAGNPELQPETSSSYELALEHRLDESQRFSLNAYATRIDDLINFQGQDFQAVNINQASIDGLEARYEWHPSRWHLSAALTLQETEDKSTGQALLRRADEKFAVTVDREVGRAGNLGVEAIYHGERLDIRGLKLDAYTLVNLRWRWPLTDAWVLTGRVENLLDEDYALTAGFNTPGLSAYLGVTWRP